MTEPYISRTRTKGKWTPAPTFYEQESDYSCSSVGRRNTGATISGVKTGTYEAMHDVVIRDYFKRRAKGEVFFNLMDKSLESVTSQGGIGAITEAYAMSCTSPVRYRRLYWDSDEFQYQAAKACGLSGAVKTDYQLFTTSELDDMRFEVSTRVAGQRGKSEQNLYESLAEYKQTLGMYNSAMNNLGDILKDIGFKKARAAANAYLLYRYGVRPLVQDIYSIAKSLNTKAERVRETTRASVSQSRYYNKVVNNIGGSHNVDVAISVNEHVVVRGMSLDEFAMTQTYKAGLSAKGLLTTPWELIPYSFVIDWFLNVGDYISSLIPTPSFTRLGSMLVLDRTVTSQYSCAGTTGNATWMLIRPVSGGITATYKYKARGPLWVPNIVVKSDFRFNDFTRLFDALSLAMQKVAFFAHPRA